MQMGGIRLLVADPTELALHCCRSHPHAGRSPRSPLVEITHMKNTKTTRNDSEGIRSLILAVAASAGAAMIAMQLAGCATSGAAGMDSSKSQAGFAGSTGTSTQEAQGGSWSEQGSQDGWYDDLGGDEAPEVTNVDFNEQSNAFGGSLPFATSKNASAMRESMYAPYAIYNGFSGNAQNAGNIAQVSYTEVGSDFDVDIDHSATFMVYASTQHDHDSDIYRKNVDGRTTTQLTNDPGHDLMPEISPDGTRIAFTSNRNGNWDVFVMPVSGGPAMQVTFDSANELHPTWSPDGSTMAYCRFNERTEQWEIWTVDCDQPTACSFVCEGMFPRWSSDTGVDRLLFQRARKRGEQLFGIWTIELHDGSGCNATEILSAALATALPFFPVAHISHRARADSRMTTTAFARVVTPAFTLKIVCEKM